MPLIENFSGYKNFAPIGVTLPHYSPTAENLAEYKCPENISNYDFLRKLCMAGVERLQIAQKPNKQVYYDRVKFELETLNSLSLVEYILLIWDVIDFCKKSNIPTGVGRGSAAGSLVLYLCDVTRLDPIENDLLFERFLSIDRVNPKVIDGITYLEDCADVDLDISFLRRHEVIQYLSRRYPNKTCNIMTMNTLSGKLCVREVFKIVAEMGNSTVDHLSSCIERVFGKVQALFNESDNPDKQGAYQTNEEFRAYCDQYPLALKISRKLEGLHKNTGVHASGIVVSRQDLLESMPTFVNDEGTLISAYDMNEVAKMAVKADCLGLRTLDLIEGVRKQTGFKISDIDLRDPKLYEMFQNLEYALGIFQIEAGTNHMVCKKVRPISFDEVSDVVALARPGALDFVGDYCDVKSGAKQLKELHPEMDKILRKTHGVVVYQEQMMQIAHKVFGFSLKDANILRGIVGKKKVAEMPKWEAKIREAGERLGVSKLATDYYWRVLIDSANYSFNKCLSPDTMVETENGVKPMFEVEIGDKILAYDFGTDSFYHDTVKDKMESKAELYEVEFENGLVLKCSMEHKIMTKNGEMKPLKHIIRDRDEIACNNLNEYS